MEPSSDHRSALLDTNVPLADETELWNRFTEECYGADKYRNIPIANSLDGLKVSNFQFENVSRVKETKKRNASFVEKVPYCTENSLILNEKTNRKANKQSCNLNSKVPVSTIQQNLYSEYSSFDRRGQVSVSEPTLSLAKHRGNSITLQDIYRHEKLVPKNSGGEGKLSSNTLGFKGCIYIKNSGKVYKSLIDAKSDSVYGDDRIPGSFGLKHRESDETYRFANSQKYTGDSSFGIRDLKVPNEECGDFEIAIYLTGIRSVSNNNMENQQKYDQNKEKVKKVLPEIKLKKKKRNLQNKEKSSARVQKKNFESVRKIVRRSTKTFVNQLDKKEKYLKHQPLSNKYFRDEELDDEGINKASEVELRLSSTSESEPSFEVPECSPIKKRQPKLTSGNGTYIVKSVVKPSESKPSEIRHGSPSHKFGTDDDGGYRFKEMSKSRLCGFSDDYRVPKLKVSDHYRVPKLKVNDHYQVPKLKMSDEYLWRRFEAMFRSYTSTTCYSREVIPRKISTVWMINAGVVGDILTEEKADSAFRQAAGAKINMNAKDYKDFLISLTIRMKLPYYEIYRRMCGL